MVPAHIAFQNFNHVVIIAFAQAAVFLNIAQFEEVELQLAKSLGELDLLVGRQVLAAEQKKRIFEPRLVKREKFVVAQIV